MKILVSCVHFAVSSGRHITRALRRLGHDVRTIGPAPGNHIWGTRVRPEYIWEPDVSVGGDGGWYIDPAWVPDLVVTADSGWTIKPIWDCAHVCWGCDNHVRAYEFDGVRFDALFVAHTWGLRMGEPNVHWLPPAYEPEDHFDAHTERDVDVALVGVMYEARVALAAALHAAGLNVLAGTGPIYDDYRALYNRAKISLVAPIMQDVPHRFLETLAMGCCVLASEMRDAAKLGFVPAVDYWTFTDAESLVREARWLLSSGEWRHVAKRGQRKALAGGHTWEDRARRMLDISADMGLIAKEPVSQ